MSKYAFLATLDIDVEFLESTTTADTEMITKNKLRILVDGQRGIVIKNLSIKCMGKPPEEK